MYAGEIVESGTIEKIIEELLHPYTSGLLSSVPDLWSNKEVKLIPGNPPDLVAPPSGCRFHPRCPFATNKCKNEESPFIKVSENHFVACHYALEVMKK